jgi:hypothetical protein
MTASLDASQSPSGLATGNGGAGRRLDWPTLAEQLLEEFPDATITDVVRELRQARDGVQHLTIEGDEGIDFAAVIARNQLSILTGRTTDVARLKPEHHQRNAPPAAG